MKCAIIRKYTIFGRCQVVPYVVQVGNVEVPIRGIDSYIQCGQAQVALGNARPMRMAERTTGHIMLISQKQCHGDNER